MVKTVIKEIIITLLLILAMILVLMVIFYNYIPNNKILPETVSYTTPATVKEEIATSEDAEQSEVIMTYEIDSTDLKNYKKTQDYVAGRKNPFSSVSTSTSNENANSTTTSNTGNTTTSTQENSSTEENNTGYLPNKGTK